MAEADPLTAPMQLRLAGSTATINTARCAADDWLAQRGAGDDLRYRVALVVSELASNAVQAAPSRPYELSMAATAADSVTISVTNSDVNDAPPPKDHWGPGDVLAPRGRGLAIVDTLADEVIVDRSRGGTVTVVARVSSAHH
jgi:anti-sigma regulatory factor (Ser/Thr protein kinase)